MAIDPALSGNKKAVNRQQGVLRKIAGLDCSQLTEWCTWVAEVIFPGHPSLLEELQELIKMISTRDKTAAQVVLITGFTLGWFIWIGYGFLRYVTYNTNL